MKREIKFRGRALNDGEWYYGYLEHYGDESIIVVINEFGLVTNVYVDPESVAQFVGHDKNGAEVYETDTLIDELENEYEATIYMRPDELRRLTLVKAA